MIFICCLETFVLLLCYDCAHNSHRLTKSQNPFAPRLIEFMCWQKQCIVDDDTMGFSPDSLIGSYPVNLIPHKFGIKSKGNNYSITVRCNKCDIFSHICEMNTLRSVNRFSDLAQMGFAFMSNNSCCALNRSSKIEENFTKRRRDTSSIHTW